MLRLLLVLPIALAACDDGKGPEEDVPADGKLDSFRSPTDHGVIPFATPATARVTADQAFHTWTFSLTGPASIHAFTSRVPHEASIDTVLYLYRRGVNGWGSYIARNDDDGRNHWSALDRGLEAGEYRVLVKGYTRDTRGQFQIAVDCTGASCAAMPPQTCLFGDAYNDIAGNANLLSNNTKVTSAAGLSELDRQRVVLAVQQSSHTDVMTAEEAFSRVDQNEINFNRIYDLQGARSFTALEYGVGDNSYGAIFYWDTAELVSSIHDGDLERCTVKPDVCLMGQNWSDLRNSNAFTTTSARVVTMASQLSGVAADQALRAIRVAYDDAANLADGLSKIDQSELNVITMKHTASGKTVDVFEYGAGDNSYGAIFKGGSTDLAAEIHDLDFYGCSVFQ